jgi:energy-coupling factor transporter ATP-binding protein EcfA2
MKPLGPRVRRVKSVQLTDFRGFSGRSKRLDTDADIVMVTGPNGFGKTSLIDALCIILTGYCHVNRCPLVCSLAGRPEATIVADLETGPSGPPSIEVTIKDDHIEPQVALWEKYPEDDRVIAARASIFYQDILECVFDESSSSVTLENFLITTPVNKSATMTAMNSASSTVDRYIRGLAPRQSIPTEQEVDAKRAQAADSFRTAWDTWTHSPAIPPNMDMPHLSDLALQDGRGMRSDWDKRLARFAKGCDFRLNGNHPSHPQESGLTALALIDQIMEYCMHLQHKVDNVIREKELKRRNVPGLLASVNDIEIILTEGRLQEGKSRIEELREKKHQVEQQLGLLYSLERHFKSQSENDMGLGDIIDVLRTMGAQWLNPPAAGPQWAVPKHVITWLDEALKGLDQYDPPVDQQLNEWNKQIIENRRALESEKMQAGVEIRSLDQHMRASELVSELASKNPTLNHHLARLKNEGKDGVRGGELISIFEAGAEAPDTLKNPMDDVLASLRDWRKLEEKARLYEEQRRKSSAYRIAYNEATALKQALDHERKKKSSIIEGLDLVPQEARRSLSKEVTSILKRFYCLPGIDSIELERRVKSKRPIWEVESADGRVLTSFSSGQKTQLAISTMLALNAALRDTLWFEVVAFDDFASALDMTQLPRLATLMRQVAYGAPNGFENRTPFRRQVFIVSHHEDLTNRLIHFLIPPEARSMKILNFVDWDSKNGPDIEQLEVHPASPVDSVRDTLGELLQEALCGGYRG